MLGIVATVVASVLFGFSFLFTKETVDRVSALTLLSWRFFTAFACMSILAGCGVFKLNFKGKKLKWIVIMAIFQPVVYFSGETIGMNLTTASESSMIIACIPIVVLILSSVFLKEKPTKLQTFGIIVSIIGVMCIALVQGFSASLNVLGYIMLLVAVLGDAVYSISSRSATEFSSFEKTYVMAALGALVFTVGAFIEHGAAGTIKEYIALPFKDMEFLKAILYLALGCQVAAFVLHNYGLGVIGANRSSSFAGITTLTGVLSGVFILKDKFGIVQWIAVVLILTGTYMANIMPKNAVVLDEMPKGGKNP